MPKCHLCGNPIEGAWATVTFGGFTSLALNGVQFTVDAKCLRFQPADRDIALPPRISDPVAEPVACGETEAECVCIEAAAHDSPHVCDCGGSWRVEAGVFHVYAYPDLSRLFDARVGA